MISCRYVGGDCSSIGEREFDTVGQRAEFSEEIFREVVIGNAPFVTEEDFKRCGFTEEELEAFGPSGARVDPPQSFNDKLAMAQQMFRDVLARMLTNKDAVFAEVSDAGT